MIFLIPISLFFFFAVPGLLLAFAAFRFRSRINKKSGGFLVVGSILILLSIFLGSGTYFVNSLGTPEDLASYAMMNAWLGGGLEYLGLLLLAIGLLVHTTLSKES